MQAVREERERMKGSGKGKEAEKAQPIQSSPPEKDPYKGKIPEESFLVFFNVPIVKFWTSIIFYLGFLILQAYLFIIMIHILVI